MFELRQEGGGAERKNRLVGVVRNIVMGVAAVIFLSSSFMVASNIAYGEMPSPSSIFAAVVLWMSFGTAVAAILVAFAVKKWGAGTWLTALGSAAVAAVAYGVVLAGAAPPEVALGPCAVVLMFNLIYMH